MNMHGGRKTILYKIRRDKRLKETYSKRHTLLKNVWLTHIILFFYNIVLCKNPKQATPELRRWRWFILVMINFVNFFGWIIVSSYLVTEPEYRTSVNLAPFNRGEIPGIVQDKRPQAHEIILEFRRLQGSHLLSRQRSGELIDHIFGDRLQKSLRTKYLNLLDWYLSHNVW